MQKFNVLFALRNVTYSAPNVHFLLVGDFTTIIFDGQLSGSMISGQFREGADRGGQFREGDAGGAEFSAKVRLKAHSH